MYLQIIVLLLSLTQYTSYIKIIGEDITVKQHKKCHIFLQFLRKATSSVILGHKNQKKGIVVGLSILLLYDRFTNFLVSLTCLTCNIFLEAY